MYDTVTIALEARYLEQGYQNKIPGVLTKVTEQHFPIEGRVMKRGYLNNYLVHVSEQGVVLNGSLAKFLYGHQTSNFLQIRDYKRGIERLSDNLKVNLDKGKIRRLDFGCNIETKKQAYEYLPLFLTMPFRKRFQFGESVVFKNKSRQYAIYDKTAELFSRGICNEGNLLRLETRFLKRIKERFSLEALFVPMLNETKIYRPLCEQWYKDYLNVTKAQTSMPELNFNTASELKNQLAALALFFVEQGTLLASIEKKQKQGLIDRSTVFRLKEMLKTLQHESNVVYSNRETLDELDEKVNASYYELLNQL